MSSSAAAEGNASSAADPSRIKDPNSLYRPAPSSLSLQMMVYFSHHYTPFFFAVNICLFTYKAVRYYYPGRFLGWELTTIFMFLLIDEVRLLMTSKGNKTSNSSAFGSAILLSLPMFVLHVYYIALQTYVLRVDVAMNAIALVFLGMETLMSVASFFNIIISTRRI